ncbi:PEP-CTERM sorting domain-containing protein [Phycisphaerales bacterium AB-hyl4]|uniref:PEP-CTERM sorting domain-containing protein n=1 Tax=Natronomicrosphaera hydrolytica TaxID=3242702 RepID=A0ABV4U197_9BACT
MPAIVAGKVCKVGRMYSRSNMMRKRIGVLGVLVGVGMGLSSHAGVAEAALYETGFEAPDFTLGQNIHGIEGWSNTANHATATISDDAAASGSQALKITSTGGGSTDQINHDVASQAGQVLGQISVGMRLRIDTLTSSLDGRDMTLVIRGIDESTNTDADMVTISFKRSNSDTVANQIIVRNGFTDVSVGTWTAEQWMDLEISLDTEADVFNLSINGDMAFGSEGADFRSNRSMADLTNVQFRHTVWLTSSYFVDDYIVVPEPASLALLVLGGALCLRRNRKRTLPSQR